MVTYFLSSVANVCVSGKSSLPLFLVNSSCFLIFSRISSLSTLRDFNNFARSVATLFFLYIYIYYTYLYIINVYIYIPSLCIFCKLQYELFQFPFWSRLQVLYASLYQLRYGYSTNRFSF